MVKLNAGVSLRNSVNVADTTQKKREATRKGSGKHWFERSDSKQESGTTDGHVMQMVFFETSDDIPAEGVHTKEDSTGYMPQLARTFPDDDDDDDESDEEPKSTNFPEAIFDQTYDKPKSDHDIVETTYEAISDKPVPKVDPAVSLFFETMDEDLKPIESPVFYRQYSRDQETVPARRGDEPQNKSRPTEDPPIFESIDRNFNSEKDLEIFDTIEDTLISEDDQAYHITKKEPFLNKLAKTLYLKEKIHEKPRRKKSFFSKLAKTLHHDEKIQEQPRRREDTVSSATFAVKPNPEVDLDEQLSLASLSGDDELVTEIMNTDQEIEAEESTTKSDATEMPTLTDVAEIEAPSAATRHDADKFREKPKHDDDLFHDIVVLQKLARQRAARNVAEQKRREQMVHSATTIQTAWRHYYLYKYSNYQCDLGNVIVVQNLVRRLVARNVAEQQQRQRMALGATAIQTAWRGYNVYSKCHCDLVDIITVQNRLHRRVARNDTEQKMHKQIVQSDAASIFRDHIILQYLERRLAATVVAAQRRRALMVLSATAIQTVWREYYAFSRYRRYRCSIIIVQAALRGCFMRWRYQGYLRKIIIVQTLVRCKAARHITELQQHERSNRSATAIQSAWRGHHTCSNCLCDLRDIVKVQSLVRRQAARNCTEKKRHDLIMQSATAIQTAWRGYYTCLRYQYDLRDIVMVQSLVRYQAARKVAERKGRERFIQIANNLCRDIIILQYLEDRLAATERKRRARIIRSATSIQTAWRRYYSCWRYHCGRRDIIIAQSIVRHRAACRITEQKRRERIVRSAAAIQIAWRGYCAFSRYQGGLGDIIMVQSLVRRQAARHVSEQKQRERIVHSSTAVQTVWRGYYTCSSYHCHLRDIILVQSLVRRRAACHVTKQKQRERIVRSTTAIQTAWRGYCAFSRYQGGLGDIIMVQSLVRRQAARHATEQKRRKRMVQSATTVQNAWRGHNAYSRYRCEIRKIIMVQSLARRQSATTVAEQKRSERMVESGTTIQTAWRRSYANSSYQRDIRSIIILQCLVRFQVARTVAEMKRLEPMVESATAIQTSWRRYYANSSHQRDLRSIIILQSLARFQAARTVAKKKRCEQMVESGSVIQTAWRRYYASSNYQHDLRNIIILQSHARRQAARNVAEMKRRGRVVESGTVIQTAWRRCHAKSSYQRDLRRLIVLQSHVRRLAEQKQRERIVESVTTIQAAWRRCYANSSYQHDLRSIIILQSFVRFQAARTVAEMKRHERMVESATTIQTSWRRYHTNSSYQRDLHDIVILQSHVRRQAARTIMEKKALSARAIQTAWRGYYTYSWYHCFLSHIMIVQNLHVAARNVAHQKRRVVMAKSATAIQTAWRGYKACLSYQCDRRDIIIAQSFVRRLAARSVAEQKLRELLFQSASVIQAQWRAYNGSVKYLHILADVLLIQSAIRRWRATKFASVFRNEVRDQAATNIQRIWRGCVCYKEYTLTLTHIVVGQSRVRSWLADRKRAKLEQKWRERMIEAATAIQAAWRGCYTYSRCQRDIRDIIIVQSFARYQAAWNAAKWRRRQRMIHRATAIQTAWRGYFTRSRYQCDRRDIVMVQSLARRQSAKSVAHQMRRSRMILSATAVQSAWRGYYTYTSYRSDLRDIITVQSLVRRQAARNVAQQMGRQRITQSATLIQSAWRCYYMCSAYQCDLRDIIIIQSLMRRQAATNAAKKKLQEHLFKHAESLCHDIMILEYLEGRLAAAERKRHKRKARSAAAIQASWRGYYDRSSYHRDLRDIIAVQSLMRRQAARIVTEQKRRERTVLSATVIQSAWRGHYVCLRYQLDLLQSLVRRQAARNAAEQKLCQQMRRKKLPRASLNLDSDDDSVTV